MDRLTDPHEQTTYSLLQLLSEPITHVCFEFVITHVSFKCRIYSHSKLDYPSFSNGHCKR